MALVWPALASKERSQAASSYKNTDQDPVKTIFVHKCYVATTQGEEEIMASPENALKTATASQDKPSAVQKLSVELEPLTVAYLIKNYLKIVMFCSPLKVQSYR